jgi:hypothetical protein
MAVVARKYTRFTTYYAVNTWRGKQVAEKVGRNLARRACARQRHEARDQGGEVLTAR